MYMLRKYGKSPSRAEISGFKRIHYGKKIPIGEEAVINLDDEDESE